MLQIWTQEVCQLEEICCILPLNVAPLLEKDAIDSRVVGQFAAEEAAHEGGHGDAGQQAAPLGRVGVIGVDLLHEVFCILHLRRIYNDIIFWCTSNMCRHSPSYRGLLYSAQTHLRRTQAEPGGTV